MFRRSSAHPSQERLLAWLDGELNAVSAWRLQRHIAGCWTCRSVLARLESAALEYGESITRHSLLPVSEINRAKWRFREAAAAFESERPPAARRPAWTWVAAASVAAAGLAIFSVAMWRPAPKPTGPDARTLLTQSLQHESAVSAKGIHEEQIRVAWQTPGHPPIERQWRVWSSPRQNRYTSRWQDAQGTLRRGYFATAAQASVYTPEAGLQPTALPRSSEYSALYQTVTRSSNDRDALERDVVGWIQRQVWQPVSLAREMAEFCTRSGAVLQVVRHGAGWRLQADADVYGKRVHMELETRDGQPPALLQMTWQGPSGEHRLQLGRVTSHDYAETPVLSANFTPEAALAPVVPPAVADKPEPPAQPPIADTEVHVLAALHEARYCMSDTVLVRAKETLVEVDLSYMPAREREAMTQTLASLLDADRIQILQSPPAPAHEAAMAASAVEPGPVQTAAAESWLRERMQVGTHTSEREMFDLMNLLVRETEDLLSAAWALEHLAQRFSPEREATLSPEAHARLLSMVAEHTADLARHQAVTGAALQSIGVRSLREAPTAPGNWQEAAGRLHQRAKHVNDLALRYFAASDAARTALEPPDRSDLPVLLGDLQETLAALRRSL